MRGKEPGCLAGWVNISKSSELWLLPQWTGQSTGQRTGRIQWNEEQKSTCSFGPALADVIS